MATLHCCLAGFDVGDALKLENLAALLQDQLLAEWSFSTLNADPCDLLLCDLDSAPGAAAWRDGAIYCGLRAAATDGAAMPGALTLRKPWRVHGPDGLLHILNEAARIGMAPASADPAPTGPATGSVMPPTPAKTGWLRSLLRATSAHFSKPAIPPAPRPPKATANPPLMEDLATPPLLATPTLHDAGILLPDAPAQEPVADLVLDAPAVSAAGEAVLYQPGERSISPALPAPAQGTAVFDAMGCDLLGLLRRSRAASQVIVFRLGEIPAICAAPANEMCYTLATLQAVFDSPAEALFPADVTLARNSYYGRTDARSDATRQPVTMPALPLKDLFWVATLRCGGAAETEGYGDGAFGLSAWPDLVTLPHARHHMTWCGLLARQPKTAAALAGTTGHNPAEAAIFLAACDELGILKRLELAPGHALAFDPPAGRALERAAVLRNVLNRLGLTRP